MHAGRAVREVTKSEMNFGTRNYVVVLGHLNTRVGDGDVEGVVGK